MSDCDCNRGVRKGRGCDSTGQCECEENFDGLKCEKCALGYFDLPNNCTGTITSECVTLIFI